MGSSQDAEEKWESELCARIEHMERGDSAIKPMAKRDYIIAGAVAALCLCAVCLGALLL